MELVAEAARGAALVGELAPGRIGILLALRHAEEWRPAVERLARTALDADPQAVVCLGSEATGIAHAARSIRDAIRVAESVLPGTPGKPYHELSAIGLRQLLYALHQDVRVQDYVEQQPVVVGRAFAGSGYSPATSNPESNAPRRTSHSSPSSPSTSSA